MRYSKHYKKLSRQKVVDAAVETFNLNGVRQIIDRAVETAITAIRTKKEGLRIPDIYFF
jgi:DNA-binding transcriptional regulator YbjK